METSEAVLSAPKTPPKTSESLTKDVSFKEPAETSHSRREGTPVSVQTPEDDTAPRSASPEDKKNFIRSIWAWSPVLVLENSGSVGKHPVLK
jgi:hypothetical protein